MNKNTVIAICVGVVMVAVVVGVLATRKGETESITLGTDVCAEFPLQWVADAIAKPITKTEVFTSSGTNVCQYYGSGTAFISIKYEQLNAENIKKGQETLGRTIQTDKRISMEHFIAMQQDGLINSIYLVVNPNSIVAIDRSSGEILASNETVIAFAAIVATRLQNGENSAVTTNPTKSTMQTGSNQKAIVESYLQKIGEKKISEAIVMMSPDAVGDEGQKQAWGVQLAAFTKLSVVSVEPSMPEEWDDTMQSYKMTIDVEMSENSASQPIPYYGYDKGRNIRWIVLKKVGDVWKIQGIATGP